MQRLVPSLRFDWTSAIKHWSIISALGLLTVCVTPHHWRFYGCVAATTSHTKHDRERSRMQTWAAGSAKTPWTRPTTRSSTLGTAAYEASVDTEHKSRGLSGRTLLKPRMVLRRQLDVATQVHQAQEGADVTRVRARPLQHSLSSLRSAHLLLCRTVNI